MVRRQIHGIASRFILDGGSGGGILNVSVNGTPVFTDLYTGDDLLGRIGLVTNWTPGRFDDVWFSHSDLRPFSLTETFEPPPPGTEPRWVALRGTWDTQGAVLNNRTAGASDIVSTASAQLDRTNNESGQTFGGGVGVISHWTPARFDDLRIESLPLR